MTRENYTLIRKRAAPRKPKTAQPQDPTPTPDDLSTWGNNATFQTLPLPIADAEAGATVESVPLVFEVTRRLETAARNDVNGLRFTGPNGVHLGHLRTTTNRIFVGGTFAVGQPITIKYYWNKAGQTQPGTGFPTAAQMLADFRLFLLFENNAPRDYAATMAAFTAVGTPTFVNGLNGQAAQFGNGNYYQTTASKLRGGARNARHAMALIYSPDGAASGRTICWADWTANQRAFQLFSDQNYVELYVDEDGVSPYQRWTNTSPFLSGWSWIGGSWTGGSDTAIVQRDTNIVVGQKEFDTPTQNTLHNSTAPYVIGGTPVSGVFHAGYVEAVVELMTAPSTDQMAAYHLAWKENAAFLGFDYTPNAFSFPSLSNQDTSKEVVFAKVQINGISAGTPISISGNGSPSFAISSSSTATDDVAAKGTAARTINNGQWVRVWHTTASGNSQTQISKLTVGTLSVDFQSSTKAAAGTGGGTGIPTGPATYTVNSLAALKTVINTQLQPGQIVEIAAGDYRSQGTFEINGKDWSGGAPPVIRASVRGYRGPMPNEGGLFLDDEGSWRQGSGGAEFSYFKILNTKNLVLDGLRGYYGKPSDPVAYGKWTSTDIGNCQDIIFQYCKFCGNWRDRNADYSIFKLAYDANNPWHAGPRGFCVGILGYCRRLTWKKCLFHYHDFYNLGLLGCSDALIEDCVFADCLGDHLRSDGGQDNLKVRRCIFYRVFSQPDKNLAHPHLDATQNTSKEQGGAQNHTYEMCIFAPGDGNTGHLQIIFYEADLWPTYTPPNGLNVVDCLIDSRVTNSIYMRPGNKVNVNRTMILQNQWGGWLEIRQPNGSIQVWRGDPLIHSPMIVVDSKTGGPTPTYTFGNNVIRDSIYFATDAKTAAGDQIINSTQLTSSGYGTHIVNFPLYTGGSYGGPGFNPVLPLNDKYVVVPSQIARWSPKTTSSLHPNNKGGAYGASNLLQYYGALAT